MPNQSQISFQINEGQIFFYTTEDFQRMKRRDTNNCYKTRAPIKVLEVTIFYVSLHSQGTVCRKEISSPTFSFLIVFKVSARTLVRIKIRKRRHDRRISLPIPENEGTQESKIEDEKESNNWFIILLSVPSSH